MSIVDYLKSQWQDSSIQARSKLAWDFWIKDYSWTAEQNINLLGQMKSATPPAPIEIPEVKPPTLAPEKVDLTKQIKAPVIPQAKIAPPSPIITPEPPKVPEVKKPTEFKPVTSHQEWIERWKKPTELVDLVESKYWITAEYDAWTNTVIWYDEAWNKTKVWSFDSAWNSRRKDIPVYTWEQFFWDFNNLLEAWDNKTISNFLQKNKELYNQNKDTLKTMVKDFQKQQEIWKTISRLSSLDWKWLYNASLDWDFTQWDDVFNGLSPEKQAEFTAYQKRYVRQDAKNTDKKIVADLKSDDAEEIYNKMAIHNPTYQDKYNEIVFENKERKELQSDLVTKYETIEKERLTLKRLKDKIDRENPSASETYKRALLNKESWALLDNIEEMTIDYNVWLAQYNMINADTQAEYQAYTLDAGIEFDTYQKAIWVAVDRYKVDKTQMNQKEVLKMQFEQADLTLKKNQEFTMKVKNFDANIKDKTWSYQTNDKWELLYVVKWVAQKVLDSTWKVVATERFQNYQESLQENEYGGYDIIRTYNDWTRPDISSYDMNWNLVWWTSSVVAGAINKVWADTLKQCWKAVNDYLQNLWADRIFKDSYESKTDQINSDVPMMWGVAIWNPNRPDWTYSEFGHVWIITWISPDWKTLEITDWNYKGDEKKMVHKVDRSVIEFNWGYHIPQGTREPTALETMPITWDVIWDKWKVLANAKAVENWAKAIKNWDQKMTDIKDQEVRNAVINVMSWITASSISWSQATLDVVNDIINHPWRIGATWSQVLWFWDGWTGWVPTTIWGLSIPATNSRDFKVLVQQLDSKLFLDNIKMMKWMWALSDAEWKKVSSAMGQLLEFWQTEEAYLKMLDTIRTITAKGILKAKWITSENLKEWGLLNATSQSDFE